MSIIVQQRLAQAMNWTARVIALCETGLLLLSLFIFCVFSEAEVNIGLLGAAIVITLAIFVISLWLLWLAGVLMLINLLFLTYIWEFSFDAFTVAAIYIPFLLGGILFLLAWWFLRKTSFTKTPSP